MTDSLSAKKDISTTQAIGLIGLAGLTSLALMLLPLISLFHYPFRLLLPIVHELGHGLAAILTGGEFLRFVVFADGSGLAYTQGGWRFVVIPAGYLGVALFGAGLILLGRSHRWSRVALGVIGGAMVLFSVRYAAPSIITSQFLGGLLTTLRGTVWSFFLWVAWRPGEMWIISCCIWWLFRPFSPPVPIAGVIGLSARFSTCPTMMPIDGRADLHSGGGVGGAVGRHRAGDYRRGGVGDVAAPGGEIDEREKVRGENHHASPPSSTLKFVAAWPLPSFFPPLKWLFVV
jgi:hypothetical protein